MVARLRRQGIGYETTKIRFDISTQSNWKNADETTTYTLAFENHRAALLNVGGGGRRAWASGRRVSAIVSESVVSAFVPVIASVSASGGTTSTGVSSDDREQPFGGSFEIQTANFIRDSGDSDGAVRCSSCAVANTLQRFHCSAFAVANSL